MEEGQPSRTALAAAAHRAAHQILDHGGVFADPLALRILGKDADALVAKVSGDPSRRALRLFIAARTRFAEDSLAAAFDRGVRQLVVLGAGLDTYAYRGALRDRLRIFEVDHPATQSWKRRRLAEAALPLPESLTFAPIDFERQTLAEGLAAAGFDHTQQTFCTWLGVVPYLTEEAIWSTLSYIANLPNGGHVVFDYSESPESLSAETKIRYLELAARVARLGEPLQTFLQAERLHSKLAALGFSEIEDLGLAQIAARYFPEHASTLPGGGGHILRAAAAI